MNIAKLFLGLCLFSFWAFGEGVPFKVSSSALSNPTASPAPTDTESDLETNLINDLKYLAVSNFLQNHLGAKYNQFDKFVTPDFSEKYILDYKVTRGGGSPGTVELVGHLDGDALKRWARLIESKTRGSNQIKPLFILSSNLPGLSFSPADTSLRQRDSSIAQVLGQMTQLQLKKLNTQLTPLDTSLGLDAPPKNISEIQSLTSSALRRGDSLVIWETISVCPGCVNPRLDIFVYNSQTQSLAFAIGDDLNISGRDLSNSELFKKSVGPLFQQFQSELENALSSGTLQELTMKIIFENVDSYRTLKVLETQLNQGNGYNSPVLKKVSGKSAEYEIKSTLNIDELGAKVQTNLPPGLKPQVGKADSSTLIVKFTK